MSSEEVGDNPEGGKKTQERNTLDAKVIGGGNYRGKNTPARESVKTAPDKRELTISDIIDDKGDQTLAGESPKKGLKSGPERERNLTTDRPVLEDFKNSRIGSSTE